LPFPLLATTFHSIPSLLPLSESTIMKYTLLTATVESYSKI
jgi:hypothetical protein